MRFVGHGHDSIRATHAKTLELCPDGEITARATCIISVASVAEPPVPMAGQVRVTVSAGGLSFGFDALANSLWQPGGPAVIRRSPMRLPGTFATSATAAASDLPRELVATLSCQNTEVEVDVEPVRGDRPVVALAAIDPARGADASLRAEEDAADQVVAEDPVARRLVEPTWLDDERQPNRTLVVATTDLPGASVAELLIDPDVDIETLGLPARLAAAAASPTRGPLVIAGANDTHRVLLEATPAGHRLVVRADPDELPGLLELAATVRGHARAVVAQDGAPPLRVSAGRIPPLPVNDTVWCCFDAVTDRRDPAALEPRIRGAVIALLDDDVPTRTAARVLARLADLPRRQAYDLVLTLAEQRRTT